MYKCNIEGGPAGYWGDWLPMVFDAEGPVEWGGHHSTRSGRVKRAINEEVSVGDVVVAYQTNDRAAVGLCRVTELAGPKDDITIHLEPIHRAVQPLLLHEAKHGTVLEDSVAVASRHMLSELSLEEARELLRLLGAPDTLLTSPRSLRRRA